MDEAREVSFIGTAVNKEEWVKRYKNFTIIVSRFSVSGIESIWNVYCVIFPKHKLFEKLPESYDEADKILKLENGATYSKWDYDKSGNVIGKKYGNDYNHVWNSYEMVTKNAYECDKPFIEAKRLHEFLKEEG